MYNLRGTDFRFVRRKTEPLPLVVVFVNTAVCVGKDLNDRAVNGYGIRDLPLDDLRLVTRLETFMPHFSVPETEGTLSGHGLFPTIYKIPSRWVSSGTPH